MSLGRGTENAKMAEIKIIQIWRRIYTPQGPVYIKIISPKSTAETTREYNLKYVSPLGMPNTPFHHFHILLVANRRTGIVQRLETIPSHIIVLNDIDKFRHMGMLPFR